MKKKSEGSRIAARMSTFVMKSTAAELDAPVNTEHHSSTCDSYPRSSPSFLDGGETLTAEAGSNEPTQ